jgi:plastocyanin
MSGRTVVSRRAAGALVGLLVASAAAADGYGSYGYGGPAFTADTWPTELVQRPRTLPRGMLELAAPLGLDVSVASPGNPATVPIAAHVGLTDWLTLGVGHTRGFCAGDANGGCAAAYDDYRVEAFARFYAAGALSAGYGAALAAASVRDGTALSAEAQLEVRLAYDRFALALAPTYGFGLDRRASGSRIAPATFPLTSALAFGAFGIVPNRETVHVPLVAELQVHSRVALAAAIAVDGVVDPVVGSFGDTFRVPVGLAAVVTPARILDVGAAFTFPNLAGAGDGLRPRSDERVIQAFVTFRTGGSSSPAAVAAPVARPPAPAATRVASAPAAAPCPAAAVTSATMAPAATTSTMPAPQVVPDAAPVPAVAREVATAEPIPAAAPAPEVVAPQPAAGFTIVIADFAFAPSTLDVPPGATVTVVNGDSAPHSVTSERAPGEFAPGAVGGVSFDTGAFVGERSFAIPVDAVPGTIVPFYCSVHRERMRTPDGAIRVVAAP